MTLTARAMAIAAALGVAAPSAARSAPPRTEARTVTPRYASVVVDATATGDVGSVLLRRLQERADVLLRRNDVLPARSPEDTTIAVTVNEITGKKPGFEFTLAVTRAGEKVGDPISAKCELCTESELVDAVESKLEGVIAELEPPAAAEPEPTAAAPVPAPEPKPADAERRRLGGAGIAGAVLLGSGAAAAIVGGTLAALPDEPKEDPLYVRSTKPPGFALLGVGLAAIIAGGVLIAVDLTRRNRRTAFAPDFGRGRAGAVVHVRF